MNKYLFYNIFEYIDDFSNIIFINKNVRQLSLDYNKHKYKLETSNKSLLMLLSINPDRRITLQKANTKFRLTKKNLEDISYENKTNPHYRSAAPMKLYNLKEIFLLTLKKYNEIEKLFEYENKLKERKNNKIKNEKIERNQREESLRNELEKYNIPLRKDSKLAQAYIDKKRKLTLEQVVKRLREVNMFFTRFNGKFLLKQLKEERERDKEFLQDNWEESFYHDLYHNKWNIDIIEFAEEINNIVYDL